MQIAIVGLGKMGMNMSLRLLRGGHDVIAFDISAERRAELGKSGAKTADSLEAMVKLLNAPRLIWLMLPAGRSVDDSIEKLKGMLSKGDVIIDGGNGYYRDDIRRGMQLSDLGIQYMDVGVSGGIWGLEEGYCLMAGGDRESFKRAEPVFKSLAPEGGYLHCGPTGAGHFVKMVHNGIEYGLMAAYGEGFEILNSSMFTEDLDFARIAHLWNRGSVVRSWLLELAEDAFKKDPRLSRIKGYVEDTGEGRWTVQQAIDSAVPAPITALSLFERFRSRETESFSDKLQAALRSEFGGHSFVRE